MPHRIPSPDDQDRLMREHVESHSFVDPETGKPPKWEAAMPPEIDDPAFDADDWDDDDEDDA